MNNSNQYSQNGKNHVVLFYSDPIYSIRVRPISRTQETREQYARRTNQDGNPDYAPGFNNMRYPSVNFVTRW